MRIHKFETWVGRSADDVKREATQFGGWSRIFPRTPSGFPNWASRIRNYFNAHPNKLRLLTDTEGDELIRQFEFRRRDMAKKFGAEIPAVLALSQDVYEDDTGRYWFEMSTGGTGYHYPEYGEPGKLKAVKTAMRSQRIIPVFKLISPDGTGGSMEICIHNWQLPKNVFGDTYGERKIGPKSEWVDVRTKIVINEKYRGSYNYSDTIITGFPDHEYRDVLPHRRQVGHYINPDQWGPLSNRIFRRALFAR